MAIPKGLWDESALSAGWFDATQQPVGWFDPDEMNTSSGASITGTLAATEAQDVALLAGIRGHVGVLAATESQDIAALAGVLVHVGTLAATEAQDTASITGTVTSGAGVTGTLAATEAQDTALFYGAQSRAVSGGGSKPDDKRHPEQDVRFMQALAALEAALQRAARKPVAPITEETIARARQKAEVRAARQRAQTLAVVETLAQVEAEQLGLENILRTAFEAERVIASAKEEADIAYVMAVLADE